MAGEARLEAAAADGAPRRAGWHPCRARLARRSRPGPLSRPHAKLEGSSHCLDCHDPKQGVAPAKCLACHEAAPAADRGRQGPARARGVPRLQDLSRRAPGGRLRARLVGQAGTPGLRPRADRVPARGQARAARLRAVPQAAASFLGAALDCVGCHKDEHRGEFQGRSCATCHGQTAWKPAPGFDHAKTRWPLTGRHAAVACEKCHTQRVPDPTEPGKSHRVFRAVAGQDCAALPRGRAPRPARPQLRELPRHERLARGAHDRLRPRQDRLSARGKARDARLRGVPPARPSHAHALTRAARTATATRTAASWRAAPTAAAARAATT